LRAGDRPKGTIAITFDDAYRDVLRNAKPVLADLGIPATVFVVTGKLGSEEGFWWDRLAAGVLGGKRPATMPHFGFLSESDRQEVGAAFADADAEALHLALWNRVRLLDPAQRESAADEVVAAFVGTLPHKAPGMTPDEVNELVEGGLISVGAHSVTHPSLPSLSTDGQREEIGTSKDALEALTGQPIRRLAYPFGDYDARSEEIARALGFDYAVSVEAGAVTDRKTRYRLPRHDIKNWTGAEFGKRLRWLN
jgi:peptidoglycan/xylan/chitin deacetylase (PgdA/CDA1 family)